MNGAPHPTTEPRERSRRHWEGLLGKLTRRRLRRLRRLLPDGTIRDGATTGRLVLEVADDSWLTATLSLPRMSVSRVRATVGFELDRLTPFAASEAYFAVDFARLGDGLRAEVFVVPQNAVSDALSEARARRLEPDALLLLGPDGSPMGEIGLPEAAMSRVARRTAYGALAAACLVAAPVLVDRVLVEPPPPPPAFSPAVVLSPRQTLELAAARDPDTLPDPVGALALVTELLDDATVLDELTLERDRVTLTGRSISVAGVLERLSADSRVREPRLTRSIAREEESSREQFGLTLVIEGDVRDDHLMEPASCAFAGAPCGGRTSRRRWTARSGYRGGAHGDFPDRCRGFRGPGREPRERRGSRRGDAGPRPANLRAIGCSTQEH